MISPIEHLIDEACKCTICGAAPGKCNCWKKKIKQPRCQKCRKLAEFVPIGHAFCEKHYAEHVVDELKPKTKEQRKLWLKQMRQILREI